MRTRLTTRHAFQEPLDASGEEILGPDHPLAAALSRVRLTAERVVAVTLTLAVGVAAVAGGAPLGPPLVLSASVVLLALLARLAGLSVVRDRQALELIGSGGMVALPAVVRVHARLVDPEHRTQLAEAIDGMRTEAARPSRNCRRLGTLYTIRVIRANESELADIAALVRCGGAVRGLARAEQLVTDGCSALYGESPEALRRELRCVRFLLDQR